MLVANGEPTELAGLRDRFGGNAPAANPGQQAITSYAGNAGMWLVELGPCGAVLPDPSTRPGLRPRAGLLATGTIYAHSCTRLASITDGTSNTMLFSERPYGLLKSDSAFSAQLRLE